MRAHTPARLLGALLIAGLPLGGCGSLSTSLTNAMSDNWPAWAGGLPADAPPRPSDPRYPAFERAQNEKRGLTPPDFAATAARRETAGGPLAPTLYRVDGKALY